MPVLEAMSHGVPVGSDGGGTEQVIGQSGVIVHLDGDFVKQLAGAIKRVLGDKMLQNNLVAMGHKRVASMSWSIAAKKIF